MWASGAKIWFLSLCSFSSIMCLALAVRRRAPKIIYLNILKSVYHSLFLRTCSTQCILINIRIWSVIYNKDFVCLSRHALEEEKTRNATGTLNLLLQNYDSRLRPKFGGKQRDQSSLGARCIMQLHHAVLIQQYDIAGLSLGYFIIQFYSFHWLSGMGYQLLLKTRSSYTFPKLFQFIECIYLLS